jgi:fructokinase
MTSARGAIVGVGEILWDLLPDGPQLGGAPFNFTFHGHQLGWPAFMVSRIGEDEWGRRIRTRLADMGLSQAYLQTDSRRPTGTVSVHLDASGQPTYTIHENVAWDHLETDSELAKVLPAVAAVCFGSLGQRSPVARRTIQEAIGAARSAKIVFDVNLRQHYWSRAVIEESLRASHWVKLNGDELHTLADLFGFSSASADEVVAELRERFHLELVCLTRGAEGCLVRTATETIEEPGIAVTVVDTIGAGDAFTAGLLVSVLEGRPLREAVRRANRLAAQVASARGGTPRIDPATLDQPTG